ncbi:hypothetical protein KFE25_008505 [Diacronema lutheri]|uniref:Transmembrane protein n=2 Tax=Diacronema lutheri TaxID=2081491 RepID=A0A8J5XT84_DIALT|nr:hypothetical protein KFE25_008505 [Diacronema lutheri]
MPQPSATAREAPPAYEPHNAVHLSRVSDARAADRTTDIDELELQHVQPPRRAHADADAAPTAASSGGPAVAYVPSPGTLHAVPASVVGVVSHAGGGFASASREIPATPTPTPPRGPSLHASHDDNGRPRECPTVLTANWLAWLALALVMALAVAGKALDEANRPIESAGVFEVFLCCAQRQADGSCSADGWRGHDLAAGTLCPAGSAAPSAQSITIAEPQASLAAGRDFGLCGYVSAGWGVSLTWELTDEGGAGLLPSTSTDVPATSVASAPARRLADAREDVSIPTVRRLLKGATSSSSSSSSSSSRTSSSSSSLYGGNGGTAAGAGRRATSSGYGYGGYAVAGSRSATRTPYGSRASSYTTPYWLLHGGGYRTAGRQSARSSNATGNGDAPALDFFVVQPPLFTVGPLPAFPLTLTVASVTLAPPTRDAAEGAADAAAQQPFMWLALCAAVSAESRRAFIAGQALWGAGCALGCCLALFAIWAHLHTDRALVRKRRRTALLVRVCAGGAALAAIVGGSIAIHWGRNPAMGAGAGFVSLGGVLVLWGLSQAQKQRAACAELSAESTPARVSAYTLCALMLVLLAVFGVLLDTRGLEWAPAVGVVGVVLLACSCGVYCDVRAEHFKV